MTKNIYLFAKRPPKKAQKFRLLCAIDTLDYKKNLH